MANVFSFTQSAAAFAGTLGGRGGTFQNAADRETVICPEEMQTLRPAVILDGAFERLSNFLYPLYEQKMKTSFSGGQTRHAPTCAYTFKKAHVIFGSFIGNNARYRIRPPREAGPPKRFEKLERIALCTGTTGDLRFGHCLNEDLPQMLLAPAFGEPARLPSKNWEDLFAYRDYMDLEWREIDGAVIEEATVFRDYSQNSNHRARFQELRRRLRDKVAGAATGGRFYLRRGDTGAALRSPDNDDEICKRLEERGYDIIDVEGGDPQKFISNILDRQIMVSVEGSHMMHLVYTIMTGGGALALMPPLQPRCAIKDACDAVDAHFGAVIGYETETGYRIDTDELGETLDRLERRVGNLEEV